MATMLPIITGFGVFVVFIVQVFALTNPPYGRPALLTRLGAFALWFCLLIAANLQFLDTTGCYAGCQSGMTSAIVYLQIAINALNIFVVWFVLRAANKTAIVCAGR